MSFPLTRLILDPLARTNQLTNHVAATSLAVDIAFDLLTLIDRLLTQPLELIVGDIPGGVGAYCFSYEVYDKAAFEEKEITVLPGISHYALYNQPKTTKPALDKLNEFFGARL